MLLSDADQAETEFELHETQGVAFETEATELLFGGAAGGGKSHLMRVSAILWCMLIPNLQVYLFRRTSPDLQKNHMEGATGFPSMLATWIRQKYCRVTGQPFAITFYNGSKIHLCHCQYEKDMFNFQGAEIHLLLIDELTHFSESIYRYLRGRVRLGGLRVPDEYRGIFPRIICGSNPGGIGHNWVKAFFIDLARPFALTRMPKEEGGMLRQYIPSRLDDNPTMEQNDPTYRERLSGLGNANLIKAMLDGDWNIVAGGAFDDVWSARVVLPRFVIPVSWRLDRAFDWGSAHPFGVGWFAEADGTEAWIEVGGERVVFCPPRGSIIMFNEWYGSAGPNKGLKLSSVEIADGILERERILKAGGWISNNINPGPADNQISNVVDSMTPTIAKEMAKRGVVWTNSDKSPGSRTIGFELVRQYLREASNPQPNGPGFWIMDHCRNTNAQIPVLPRDTRNAEDVDTNAEDHMYDVIRYRVLATKQHSIKLKMTGF